MKMRMRDAMSSSEMKHEQRICCVMNGGVKCGVFTEKTERERLGSLDNVMLECSGCDDNVAVNENRNMSG